MQTRVEDGIAVVRLDDGRANALSPEVVASLQSALDRAEKEARAVVVMGREGRLSGGFDLATMRSGPSEVRALVHAGAELFLRMLSHPLPLVVGCSGHAVAAGAILLLAADARLGARGDYKIGLSEVAIGLTLPIFALELARERLSRRHFVAATTQARMYAPDAAVDAGYLDRLVDAAALEDEARAEAARLAALAQPAFRDTKARAHAALLARVRETLDADLDRLTGRASR